jgi:phospholipid transport system substrate-binding protein
MKKTILAIFLIIFSAQNVAKADSKNDAARKFVDEIGKKIVAIANEKTTPEKKKKDKIIQIIDSSIDADWIAHFVLGKNYKTATDEQRAHFTQLYREFMINTYGPKFKNYNGRKFDVVDVTEQKGFYVAKAEFLPRDSDVAVSIAFRVKERNGKLVILDFIAEGISLIETQRSEFNSTIASDGMDKFLDQLSERVKKLKNSDN